MTKYNLKNEKHYEEHELEAVRGTGRAASV